MQIWLAESTQKVFKIKLELIIKKYLDEKVKFIKR
jgi:hypothetical protein